MGLVHCNASCLTLPISTAWNGAPAVSRRQFYRREHVDQQGAAAQSRHRVTRTAYMIAGPVCTLADRPQPATTATCEVMWTCLTYAIMGRAAYIRTHLDETYSRLAYM